MPALVTVESLLHARGVWSRVDGDIGPDDARLLAAASSGAWHWLAWNR